MFCDTSHIIPPVNFFSLSCTPIYFSLPDLKSEGVLWYISYYSPLHIFFASPVCLLIFPFRILKLKVFCGTPHIIPPCKFFYASPVRLFSFPPFPDLKTESVLWYISYYSPPAHFFRLSCVPTYFSLPDFKTEGVLWYISYYSPPANSFMPLLCAYLFFHPFRI